MKTNSNLRDINLRTSQPPGEMWHAYVHEILSKLEQSSQGLISTSSRDFDRREAA